MTWTRFVLRDGYTLTVSRSLESVQEACYAATERGGWVEIEPHDGGSAATVNPLHVLYLEEWSPEQNDPD